MEYNFTEIEKKWQKYWEENKTFSVKEDPDKPKYYVLDMYPYPSGSGLHVGHPEGYTATDIVARYKRMRGFNVLHPMGWDAFGLPAEQYAIQTGTHPAIITNKNCDTFRQQIKSLGLAYDWDREINTTDPDYYKWTQWIFSRIYNAWFDEKQQKGRPISELPIPDHIRASGKDAVREYTDKHRLAYYANAHVWYCENCRIVCANEEVLTDGSHEKCGNPVIKKNLKQWLLRIPLYAERLLREIDNLDWPEGIKDQQKNWIGRSEGAEVDFMIEGLKDKLRVFTTRPDTLFGATYMVLAPEHPLLNKIRLDKHADEMDEYIRKAAIKTDLDRTDLAKEKTGVFTGRYAINPVNKERIPIWVADYVMMGYGTGAIMAVPAHDTRDFEFAEKFGLSIRCIMDPVDADMNLREKVLNAKACWTEDGIYINSSSAKTGLSIDGMNKENGIRTVTEWLEKNGLGKYAVNYKIRDWLFSRQRYWGEPFPVIHWEDGEITLIDDSELPLRLPELQNYEPGKDGESPLANAGDWLNVVDENGRKGRRETNTMPQWAGSCWYYLRYIDSLNTEKPFDSNKEKYWMPVDLYIGGAEHAVLHLLYSRFWHKILYDLGIVSTDEPFPKLFNQGMILAYAYESPTGAKIPSDEVEERDGRFFHKHSGTELKQIVAKMSKSLKNVINPDEVTKNYGADSMRLYEMFMGPLEATKPWSENGIKGVSNFLNRVYKFFGNSDNISHQDDEDREIMKSLHQTIKKAQSDIENLRFNTAIAQMMIFTNICFKKGKITRKTAETFVLVLSVFAPHLGEELWQLFGHTPSVSDNSWPAYDESYLVEEVFEYPVSFNGKLRFRIELPLNLTNEEIEEAVLSHEKAQKWLNNKTPRKVIIVHGKIVNIVL
ncbi:MAG: leucyl-tRNA synthase [Bacteroides sp. SM23_62_1]|nr:MAG: leucyl-tRNA synthase [Bacteroides sp. SM23_62_1]